MSHGAGDHDPVSDEMVEKVREEAAWLAHLKDVPGVLRLTERAVLALPDARNQTIQRVCLNDRSLRPSRISFRDQSSSPQSP